MSFFEEYKKRYHVNSYEEADEIQRKYLDSINMNYYIKYYNDLTEMYEVIERDYDYTDLTNNYFLENNIFNHMNLAEFKDYLEKNYNVKYVEYTTYRRAFIKD